MKTGETMGEVPYINHFFKFLPIPSGDKWFNIFLVIPSHTPYLDKIFLFGGSLFMVSFPILAGETTFIW